MMKHSGRIWTWTIRCIAFSLAKLAPAAHLDSILRQRDSFSSFGSGLAQTTRNAARAFGNAGGTSQIRMIVYVVVAILGLWFGLRFVGAVWSWWTAP